MSLLDPRSEVVTDDDGWVWLRPRPASLRLTQVLAWALLAVTVAVGAAGVAFLERLVGLLVAAASLVVAIALARLALRSAHTRAGVSAVGLLVQSGARVLQAGWPAVAAVSADPRSGRARLSVQLRDGPTHHTGATFSIGALKAWLEHAARFAYEAGEAVEPHEGRGFTLDRR